LKTTTTKNVEPHSTFQSITDHLARTAAILVRLRCNPELQTPSVMNRIQELLETLRRRVDLLIEETPNGS
jgi:hypothetical protein